MVVEWENDGVKMTFSVFKYWIERRAGIRNWLIITDWFLRRIWNFTMSVYPFLISLKLFFRHCIDNPRKITDHYIAKSLLVQGCNIGYVLSLHPSVDLSLSHICSSFPISSKKITKKRTCEIMIAFKNIICLSSLPFFSDALVSWLDCHPKIMDNL